MAGSVSNLRISSGGAVRSSGPVKSVSVGRISARRGGSRAAAMNSVQSKDKVQLSSASFRTEAAPGPSADFRLGEVYVYPNPAKRGAIPIFHIEVGIADSVKIRIYNVAGDIAHERMLVDMPQAIYDGNGLSYAYEYPWDGHIPSGVYYYTMEALKGSKTIKKAGKLAVIR